MLKCEPFEFSTDRSWADEPMIAESSVGRVLVVGDVHRSVTALGHAAGQAKRHKADAIVQVGDFWLADRHWNGHDSSLINELLDYQNEQRETSTSESD